MATDPKPIYLGEYSPVKVSDLIDLSYDITNDLVTGDTISSVAFTVTNSAGTTQAGAVTTYSSSGFVVSFRLQVPATAGVYDIKATSAISDGQIISHTAKIQAVA